MSWYRWESGDLWLSVRVQLRARQNSVEGVHDHCLRLRLTAPPIDNQANVALSKWLAGAFAVTRAEVAIARGASARTKLMHIVRPRRAPQWFIAAGGVWPPPPA